MKLAQINLSKLANGGNDVAPAFWSAPALRRFSGRPQFSAVPKAAEDCRSPKPRGVLFSTLKLAQTNLGKLVGRVTPCAPSSAPARAAGRGLPALPNILGFQRKDAKAQRRQRTANNFFAALRLCSAISKHHRVLQKFSRSADSLVRQTLALGKERADKAVRAPWVAASPRCALALKNDVALPPLRGLRHLNIQPTADAVGYYRPPLRGFDLARG